jgi:hypothetical protein
MLSSFIIIFCFNVIAANDFWLGGSGGKLAIFNLETTIV